MKNIIGLRIFPSILVIILFFACSRETGNHMESGLNFYKQNLVEEANVEFKKAVDSAPDNAEAFCWLAETYRRLGKKEEALTAAQTALDIDSCSSFANTVMGDLYNPMFGEWEKSDADLSWKHLLAAVDCDSNDGNAWLGIWSQAMIRNDIELEKKALTSMIKTGILTPAVLSYNRWVLKLLPENAILLTNGDMDTYPALALQESEGFRKDVNVINYSLLNTPWYRNRFDFSGRLNKSGKDEFTATTDKDGKMLIPSYHYMKALLEASETGVVKRPVAIAHTVFDLSFTDGKEDQLSDKGPYKLWLNATVDSPDDTTAFRIALEDATTYDFTGSFVSPDDRSSVRAATTNKLASNITSLAMRYADLLHKANRTHEALDMLDWASQFEKNTLQGPQYSTEIANLKSVFLEKK